MRKYVRCISGRSVASKDFDLEENKIYEVESDEFGCYVLKGLGDKQYITGRFVEVDEEIALKEGVMTNRTTSATESNNDILDKFLKDLRDEKCIANNLAPILDYDDMFEDEEDEEDKVSIRDIALEVSDLVERKNKDYNNSYANTVDKYGYATYFIRMEDKLNRLENLLLKGNVDSVGEKIEDTLDDIIGYTLLTKQYILNKK